MMFFPATSHLHRAVVTHRLVRRCQLQSIAPRIISATNSYHTTNRQTSPEVTASSSDIARQICSPTLMPTMMSPTNKYSWLSVRQFSTAPEYSTDEAELYDNDSPDEDDEHMPRLKALREKLRLETEQDEMTTSQHDNLSVQSPLESARGTTTTTTTTLIEPEIDYSTSTNNILTDTHGRHHNYLRISLSERCNLRCQYCMPPEGVPLSPKSKLLTDDEIRRLVKLFVRNGVNKVRLTGGEPLLRPNLVSLVQSISDTLSMKSDGGGDAQSVGITTNGISLSRHIDALVDAGLTGVNISLDTVRADRFTEITRRNGLDKVLRAIDDTIHAFQSKYGDVRVGPNGTGGSRVKINCVVMKGFNDDELADFVRMADERYNGNVDMRFIEWMPFNDNGWNTDKFLSYKDVLERIATDGLPLERIGDGPNDTTKWWRVQSSDDVVGEGRPEPERRARIGFITSMSEHFCSTCNRLRITADGKIKVCLFGSNEKEVSLRDIMRIHQHEDVAEQELAGVIHAAVQRKTFALGGHDNAEDIAKAADNRPMTLIGG